MSDAPAQDIALTHAITGLVAAADALGRLGDKTVAHNKSAGPRRGLSRTEAANYVGVSPTTFDTMVKDKSMPKPVRIGSRRVWDVKALDAAFDNLASPADGNPWDAWS
jgi:predicted DNA-binding transcriptional regulator AlpA